MLPEKLNLTYASDCKPMPGGIAGYAWRIEDDKGNMLAAGEGESCRGQGTTNFVADFMALEKGLIWLNSRGWKGTLRIWGNMTWTLRALMGEYKTEKPHLAKLITACLLRLTGIDYDAVWICRKDNDECHVRSLRYCKR